MICGNCGIAIQSDHMGIEDRLGARFGISYNAFVAIANRIKGSTFKNPVILLPPNDYIHAMKLVDGTNIPEPAVFYYFTGLKSVVANSPTAGKANLVLLVKNNRLWIDVIQNRQQCDSFVTVFKKYIK